MARQEVRAPKFDDVVRDGLCAATDHLGLVGRQVEDFADRHDVDPSRLMRVLSRLDQRGGSDTAPPRDIWDLVGPCLQATRPALHTALHYLPPNEALALFEQADLSQLADREARTTYLAGSVRFLSLEELADVLEASLAVLEQDREPLTRTGHPAQTSGLPDAFDYELAPLYPTALPEDAWVWRVSDLLEGDDRPRDAAGNLLEGPAVQLLEEGRDPLDEVRSWLPAMRKPGQSPERGERPIIPRCLIARPNTLGLHFVYRPPVGDHAGG